MFNEIMNKILVKSLYEFADVVATRFSFKDREGNVNKESFKVHEVIPTSDQTAIVFFQKSTQKIGMGFFYYINKGSSKGWKYFFPTDSHVVGMMACHYYKLEVERFNSIKNLDK
ncbi:MAG TPA: hypothetical protein DCM10_09285 [Xanthomarina gelatinilytica]|nr:hypothetical protein [Xanthomarina gelatinilytica]